MKKLIGSILVVAGLAASAQAQTPPTTQFNVQLSRDGTTWTNNLDISNDNPRTGRVFARVLVSYIQNDGPTPLFMNGVRAQPTISNFDPALDTAIPLSNLDVNGRARSRVANDIGPGATPTLGRTFGAATIGTSDAVTSHLNGSTLRYAAFSVTNAIGTGAGSNNIDGSRAINWSNNTLAPTLGLTNLQLFTFGIDTSTNQANRVLTFDVPRDGVRRFVAADETAGRGADWVITTSPFFAQRANVVDTIVGTLTVPAPASLALLGLGGLAMGRRRR